MNRRSLSIVAIALVSFSSSLSAKDSWVTLEGQFGKTVIDAQHPSISALTLRAPSGELDPQSVLSAFPRHGDWTQGGYTYVVGNDGILYQSKTSAPEEVNVEKTPDGGATTIRLRGIQLSAKPSEPAVATEDWTLTTEGDALVWKIERRWLRDLTYGLSGTPGLFSTFHSRSQKNATTSTMWIDPEHLAGRTEELYRQGVSTPGFFTSTHPCVDVTTPDAWAIYKLWTNWNAQSDLRMAVAGGHLFRRGSYALVSEMGATAAPGPLTSRKKDQVETVTVRLSPTDKKTTGYQLNVSIPDKKTESALKDFYSSLLNGGTVNDQKNYNFGNESDGWYVALSAWMQTAAIGSGLPAPGELSSHPFQIPAAYRGHLRSIFATVDEQGLAHFGYNKSGACMDDHCILIIATNNYALHTGDLDFVRENLPAMERTLGYFVNHRNEQGLYDMSRQASAHWYYDTVNISGVSSYHNALFYKATCDLAALQKAVGNPIKAAEYMTLAADLKAAFNKVLWKEDAPGGPRYLDWIDAEGREVNYFCDMAQWPTIVYGLASPEQARKIVATADTRIKELEISVGYKGYASMSALWSIPDFVNPEALRAMQVFPVAMNGGSYLAMTYWEIVARARAGDRPGAWNRLRLFAERASRDGWNGFNCFGPNGELEERARPESDGEPYLADMVTVPAALVNGILGIEPTWDGLTVTPSLPEGWTKASAELQYRGQRTRVEILDGKATITPVARKIEGD